MSINWSAFNRNANRQEIGRQIAQIVTPDNYGFDNGQWNLTDIIVESSSLRFPALQLIAGDQPNGKPSPGGPMRGRDGEKLRFRLQVLTRQACSRDKDGNPLNGWDKDKQGDGNPEPGDSPQHGDVVRIKGDFKQRDSAGNELRLAARVAARHRGEEIWNYAEKIVDEDGCISCNYAQAHQLLSQKGYRIVFPEHRQRDKAAEEKNKPQRTITNWHFKEVPVDYKKPNKRGRPPKAESAA
jgi:hypothetical protein